MSRATSERGYYVRGQAGQLIGNEGMDAGIVRDGIANNLNHLQDQQTQHAGSLCLSGFSIIGNSWTQAVTTPGTMLRLDQMPSIPVMLHMQSDGSSSRIQVTIGLWADSGQPSTFRIVLTPMLLGRLNTVVVAAGSSPRVADLTSTASASKTQRCTLYVSRLDHSWIPDGMYGLDGNGGTTSVNVFMGMVEVWATTTSAAKHPHVDGISVREYVG